MSELEDDRLAVYDVPLARVTTLDLRNGEFSTRRLRIDGGSSGGADSPSGGRAHLSPDGTATVRSTARLPTVDDPGLVVRGGSSLRFGLLEAGRVRMYTTETPDG